MAAYGPKPTPPIDRVERACLSADFGYETPCRIFQGAITRGGYGQIRVGSMTNGTRRFSYVHRVIYEHYVGPIPKGMQIDHLCRQRACCEHTHLEVVTQQENLRRGWVSRGGRKSVAA